MKQKAKEKLLNKVTRFEIPSHSDPYGSHFVLTSYFLKTIFEVDGHDFLKTNAPILLKLCTFLDKID